MVWQNIKEKGENKELFNFVYLFFWLTKKKKTRSLKKKIEDKIVMFHVFPPASNFKEVSKRLDLFEHGQSYTLYIRYYILTDDMGHFFFNGILTKL